MIKSFRQLYAGKIILLLALLFVVVGVWRLVVQLGQPETVAVNSVSDVGLQDDYNVNLTPKLTTGRYVSFNHPQGIKLISAALVSSSSVEDFTFYVKDVASWTLAVDVIRTPTGKLSESSSYMLRKNNPATYNESQATIHGQSVPVMTDTVVTSGFSKVAYLTHGNLVASVSLIGNDSSGTGPLESTFAMVLNSWNWLQ